MRNKQPLAGADELKCIGVVILTALSLHGCIYTAGGIATGIWERSHGYEVVIDGSPLILGLWFIALNFLVWRGKPGLLTWSAPFTIAVFLWFIVAMLASWHPDDYEEGEIAAFARAMFSTCGGIWVVAVVVAAVRGVFKMVRSFKEEGPANETIETIYSESKDKRLVIFWRPHGNYGFSEEHLNRDLPDSQWILHTNHSKSFLTLQGALQAAHAYVRELNSSAQQL